MGWDKKVPIDRAVANYNTKAYNCREIGHFASKYPKPRHLRENQKVLIIKLIIYKKVESEISDDEMDIDLEKNEAIFM